MEFQDENKAYGLLSAALGWKPRSDGKFDCLNEDITVEITTLGREQLKFPSYTGLIVPGCKMKIPFGPLPSDRVPSPVSSSSPTLTSSNLGSTLGSQSHILRGPSVDDVIDGLKFGKMNIQNLIISSAEGKDKVDALQKRFKPLQEKLKKRNEEVENLKKQLAAQDDKLSQEDRRQLAKELDSKIAALRQDLEKAQHEFQQAQQEIVNEIGNKALKLLEDYAKTHGYAVVFDLSADQPDVLWASVDAMRISNGATGKEASTTARIEALRARFVNNKALAKATDITQDLIAAYDAQFPLSPR